MIRRLIVPIAIALTTCGPPEKKPGTAVSTRERKHLCCQPGPNRKIEPSGERPPEEPENQDIALLRRLPSAEPVDNGYNRKDWKHWIDEDGDCQDTRQEVLIAESEVEVTFETERQCRVATGRWTCPYTGEVFTDPGKLDVGHLVPLKAAHAAGGHAWDAERRQRYANSLVEPHHLVAVKASANRSKRADGPDAWLPDQNRCEYVHNWVRVKLHWGLAASSRETTALEMQLAACAKGETAKVPMEHHY